MGKNYTIFHLEFYTYMYIMERCNSAEVPENLQFLKKK